MRTSLLLSGALLGLTACRDHSAGVVDGDPARGAAAIYRYGCGSCHTVGGLRAAHGLVGPSLAGLSGRMFLAGMLPNTPENLMRWVQNPHAVKEKTAMPKLDVSSQDAHDIAAYLYSRP